jgi:hypothetical protein
MCAAVHECMHTAAHMKHRTIAWLNMRFHKY